MANIINLSLNFQPGVSYKLKIPTTLNNDGGFTCKDGSVTLSSGDIVELKKGFCVEYSEVGELHDVFSNELAIRYDHKLPRTNIIWFYAYTGECVRILSQPVQVHDHSSISQGGPAYGTYFSYNDG